jgi:hypothetical protein
MRFPRESQLLQNENLYLNRTRMIEYVYQTLNQEKISLGLMFELFASTLTAPYPSIRT